MTTSLAKISTSSKITNFITWPIQSKANSIRTSLPIIVFVATKMLANTSYLHSLLITGITLISSEFIYHQMNKSRNIHENLPERHKAANAHALEPRKALLRDEKEKSEAPADSRTETLPEEYKSFLLASALEQKNGFLRDPRETSGDSASQKAVIKKVKNPAMQIGASTKVVVPIELLPSLPART